MSKERDWTKLGTCEGMARWILEQGDCLCVLVVRPNDAVIVIDPRCAPRDAGEAIVDRLPLLLRAEVNERKSSKSARVDMGPAPE